MNFSELIKERQSDRVFDSSKPVEKEKLERILEAGRLAPSACNAQPWKFVVVDDVELKNQVADCTSSKVLNMNHFTKQAPVHIIIVEENANISSSFGSWAKKKHFPHIDIGIATAHICLAAEAEGLGTCIIGWFDEKKLKKMLEIPPRQRALLDIVLGYPVQATRPKVRKSPEEVLTYNKYR